MLHVLYHNKKNKENTRVFSQQLKAQAALTFRPLIMDTDPKWCSRETWQPVYSWAQGKSVGTRQLAMTTVACKVGATLSTWACLRPTGPKSLTNQLLGENPGRPRKRPLATSALSGLLFLWGRRWPQSHAALCHVWCPMLPYLLQSTPTTGTGCQVQVWSQDT